MNTIGLSALEYAAKEGHTACAELLADAGSLPALPRARAALCALAQAPWRLLATPPGPLGDGGDDGGAAAEQLVRALRRLLQPHSRDDAAGVEQLYFEAGPPLLQRLAPLDAPGEDVEVNLERSDDDDDDDDRPYMRAYRRAAARHMEAAAPALTLAGALAAPGVAPMTSLLVRGCPLSARTHIGEAMRSVELLTKAAMTALGDALAQPGAPRHVTLQLAVAPVPQRPRYMFQHAAGAGEARLPGAGAGALAQALRAVWMQDGGSTMRSLTLSLPRDVRLCPQQVALLRQQARQPQHDAVTALLLGTHGRCGAQSPVRLLSAEVLRRILASCTVSVRIIETPAV